MLFYPAVGVGSSFIAVNQGNHSVPPETLSREKSLPDSSRLVMIASVAVLLAKRTGLRDAIRDSFIQPLYACQNAGLLVGNPDPFLNQHATVIIPVPPVRPVTVVPVPDMNLALVLISTSVPSDRNF